MENVGQFLPGFQVIKFTCGIVNFNQSLLEEHFFIRSQAMERLVELDRVQGYQQPIDELLAAARKSVPFEGTQVGCGSK